MKMRFWAISLLLIISAIAGVILIPSPLSKQIQTEVKARGYLPYTPEEATTLAYSRCTTCHEAEKMLQYCSRCGPPFVVVAHSMKKYVELSNLNQKSEKVRPFSDAELTTIIQVWNALVGNWEGDWRQQDIKRLLQGDQVLIRLLETPLAQRPIEMALRNNVAPGSYKEIQTFGEEK